MSGAASGGSAGEDAGDPVLVGSVGGELEVPGVLGLRLGVLAEEDVDHAQAPVGGRERGVELQGGGEGGFGGFGVEGAERQIALCGLGFGGGAVAGLLRPGRLRVWADLSDGFGGGEAE